MFQCLYCAEYFFSKLRWPNCFDLIHRTYFKYFLVYNCKHMIMLLKNPGYRFGYYWYKFSLSLLIIMLRIVTPSNTTWSTVNKQSYYLLGWKTNTKFVRSFPWILLLNIILNINSFSAFNVTVNATTFKAIFFFLHMQALCRRIKLMRGVIILKKTVTGPLKF